MNIIHVSTNEKNNRLDLHYIHVVKLMTILHSQKMFKL